MSFNRVDDQIMINKITWNEYPDYETKYKAHLFDIEDSTNLNSTNKLKNLNLSNLILIFLLRTILN